MVAGDGREGPQPQAECCQEAPPIMEFTSEGVYLQGWGGPGQGYEWPADEHGIHIDYKNNVWISSAGGPRLPERVENHLLNSLATADSLCRSVGGARARAASTLLTLTTPLICSLIVKAASGPPQGGVKGESENQS